MQYSSQSESGLAGVAYIGRRFYAFIFCFLNLATSTQEDNSNKGVCVVWLYTYADQADIFLVCLWVCYISYRRGLTGVAYPWVGQCESLRNGISKNQIPHALFVYAPVKTPYYNIPAIRGNQWHKAALQVMHIGQLIKQQMDLQGKTTSWLARELAYSRTNVYKIYDKKSIDTDLLLRISRLLQYDFFKTYSQVIEGSVANE